MNKKIEKINLCKFLLVVVTTCLSLFTACTSETKNVALADNQPVVSVYGNTLSLEELQNAIPSGLSPEDSTVAADSYINMWIKEELVYDKAKKNVANKEEIASMVENYRQSLTTYTYLEQLLKDELSKSIKDSELKEYYDQNTDNFILESALVKGLFLKIPQSSSELANFKKWYQSNKNVAREQIEKASIQNTVIYDDFYDKWVSLDDVSSKMPLSIDNQVQFLKNNKNFEIQDSLYVYLLHIEEFASPGTKSPFEYSKSAIKDILINKHRTSYLKTFEADLLESAKKKGEINYYISNPNEK